MVGALEPGLHLVKRQVDFAETAIAAGAAHPPGPRQQPALVGGEPANPEQIGALALEFAVFISRAMGRWPTVKVLLRYGGASHQHRMHRAIIDLLPRLQGHKLEPAPGPAARQPYRML